MSQTYFNSYCRMSWHWAARGWAMDLALTVQMWSTNGLGGAGRCTNGKEADILSQCRNLQSIMVFTWSLEKRKKWFPGKRCFNDYEPVRERKTSGDTNTLALSPLTLDWERQRGDRSGDAGLGWTRQALQRQPPSAPSGAGWVHRDIQSPLTLPQRPGFKFLRQNQLESKHRFYLLCSQKNNNLYF